MGYLIPKLYLWKNNIVNIYPIPSGYKEVLTFSKNISLKVNIIAQLEFDLPDYDLAVQHVSYYDMETSLHIVTYKRVVARKIRLTRRFSLFRLLNK